jgi:hypothetical protein
MKSRLSLFALLLVVGAVQAEPADSDMIRLARSQTLRVSVIAEADDMADLPPGSCKVFLGFLDSAGKLVSDSAGRRISRQIDLEPGQTAHLDIHGRDVSPGLARHGRTALLPAVQVQPGEDGKSQCPGVIASVEVLDHETGPNVISLGDSAAY